MYHETLSQMTIDLEFGYWIKTSVFGQNFVSMKPYSRGLHPNVAWAMVSAAQIQPGEVVLDPMCGTGMLLTEAPHCGLVIGAQGCA